jgi:hypothetical protein
VFNANGPNLASGLTVSDGSFTQYNTGTCGSKPVNLVLGTGFSYGCATSLPSGITNLSEPLPTAKPAAAPSATTVSVSGVAGCSSYTVYHPGLYASKPSFAAGATSFLESGVYVFENGVGGLDNGAYVIGGAPSPGDVVSVAQNSPCWNTIKNSSYFTNGTGSGVEWILGKSTWLDVHSVNMELFTRVGGPASEGAQGLSVRDVSGIGSGSVWYTDVNTVGGPGQLFQVDANNHSPNVYVHGGLYMPNENIEEFTNSSGVTLGPMFANSIEFTFNSVASPPLTVSAGSPGNATVVLTATTGQVTVQAYIPFDTSGNMVTDPNKGYTWRVLSPS